MQFSTFILVGWKSFSKKNKLNLKVICLGCDVGREDSLDAIGVNAKLGGKVASLEEEVRILSQNMKLLLEHSPDLTRLLAVARTEMRKRKKTRTHWNQGQGVSFHNLILLRETY